MRRGHLHTERKAYLLCKAAALTKSFLFHSFLKIMGVTKSRQTKGKRESLALRIVTLPRSSDTYIFIIEISEPGLFVPSVALFVASQALAVCQKFMHQAIF